MKKLGIIGIIVQGDHAVTVRMQELLFSFRDIIIGRMGIPQAAENTSAISLVVKGTVERISALTGQLGRLDSIAVKSAITSAGVKE